MRWPVIVFACVTATLVAAPFAVLAQPPEMQPSIMWGSVLDSVQMRHNTGDFWLTPFDPLVAVFLPPAESNTTYPYNPTDGGKFWAILSSADGTQLLRYDFWAAPRPVPFWPVDDIWVTNPVTGERIDNRQLPLEPGDYSLDFFLDSGQVLTFSFSVSKLDSDDPFRPQSYWFLDGPWRDWGCLTYAEADPGQVLRWIAFARNKAREKSRTVRIEVVITRDADGTVVCTSRPGMSWDLMPEWRRFDFDLVHPTGAQFEAGALLARNGAYTLRMNVDGQAYGTWRFQVANGQLQYVGRAVRGVADRLTFVEGGMDEWWYIRQESGEAPGAPSGAETGATDDQQPTGATGGQSAGAPQVIPGATPITINGHTMVPLRSVFEWLGAEVKWIPQALSIYASRGDDIIVLMRLDESEATVNGQKVPLPQPPVQRDGVTYVPLRFSAEAFGATVGFDAATGAITITDGERVGLIPAR